MNVVQFFKALADETRLRIVNLLINHELNVNELTAILGMGQSRISRHLKILTEAGILNYRRDGLWSFYALAIEGHTAQWLNETVFTDFAPADHKMRTQVLMQRTHDTTRLFNTLAGKWEKIKQDIFGQVDVNGEIINSLSPCMTLVDIGCGTGDLLRAAKDKAGQLIGVDNSPGMLERAGEKLDLRLGNIEHLPLRDREADTAVLNMVLHHVDVPVVILKEAHRVLKDKGTLILADFVKHNQEVMRSKYGDRRLGFDPAELEEAFRETGFAVNKPRIIPLDGGLAILLYKTNKEELL